MKDGPDHPRARMVRSAALLIQERGVAGTGMRDIAERAEAPRGSLQHYFPDGKDQVVGEALDWITDQVTAPLDESEGSAADVVARMFGRWRTILGRRDFLAGCPVVATITDASGNPALRVKAAATFVAWRASLTAALARGGVAPARAERLAVVAISALEGAIVLARAAGDLADFDAVADEVAQLVTDAAGVSG